MKSHFLYRLPACVAPFSLAVLLAAALTAAFAAHAAGSHAHLGAARRGGRPIVPRSPDRAGIAAAYGKLPLAFEVNRGQADPRARFLARGPGYMLALTPTEALLSLSPGRHGDTESKTGAMKPGKPGDKRGQGNSLSHSSACRRSGSLVPSAAPSLGDSVVKPSARATLRMKLVGANPSAEVTGLRPLPGSSNYFIGIDPKMWRTYVPQFASVRCRNVYPGVDLIYYGNQRQLEYDFVLSPGADPEAIRLEFAGADRATLDRNGDLVLHTPAGDVLQHRPRIYQEVGGERRRVDGGYVVLADERPMTKDRRRTQNRRPSSPGPRGARASRAKSSIAFRLGAYDHSRPLVIDPQLVYSTYLGGSLGDAALGVAVDAVGNAYVAGQTFSVDFPTANPLQGTLAGGNVDAFVAKLNSDGSALVYSTYLGGSGTDAANAVSVDPAGNACVAGYTNSNDFPLANALQSGYAGGTYDAFVAKLDPTGSALVYSTYIGGSGEDGANAVALDSSGNAYVAGRTSSANFPTASPLQDHNAGKFNTFNAFLAKLNPAGSAFVYSTYLGGSSGDTDGDAAYAVAVDGTGSAYVVGYTTSLDFPTANALQPSHAGGQHDAFVAKLNPAGSALVYSTYLGGEGQDYATAVAVDTAGSAYVAGFTASLAFPTRNPLQATNAGVTDGFVTKLDPSGSSLVYSTYLGGSDEEQVTGIAIDGAGNAYVSGFTLSADFPVVDAVQATFGGDRDGFVVALNPAGSALVYSTYLGGSRGEGARAVAVDGAGNAYIAGVTLSTDFPITAGAFQTTNHGSGDAFVAKIGSTAPPPPLNLVATPGNAQVTLTWSASAGATSYNLYKATVSGGPYAPIARHISRKAVVDYFVLNGATYFYIATANGPGGESAPSNEASATPPGTSTPPPPAPTNLVATSGNDQVMLSWSPSNGGITYNIYRSTVSGGPYLVIARNVSPKALIDTRAANGTTYYYVVTAVGLGGESGPSNEASATPSGPGLPPPPAPTNLVAVAGSGQVTLTWSASTGWNSYNMYRSTVSGGPYIATARNISLKPVVDRAVASGTTYYYVVTANGPGGESGPSNEASATP